MAPPAILATLACLASCTAIGPTVLVSPGPDKSQVEFAGDRTVCGRATDQQLQPIATKLSVSATSSQQMAANNRWIQDAYNASYARCMTSRGDVVPSSLAANVASGAVTPSLLAGAAEGSPTSEHLGAGWQLLGLSYHAKSGRPRDANDALWLREIADPSAAINGTLAVYSVVLADGPRSVMVSIASQANDKCDGGPNDVNATRDYAVCPGKLAILAGDRLIATRSVGPLCAEAINAGDVREGAPDWKDPARWGTRARYDKTEGTVELMTMQGGRIERACSKTIKLR